MRRHETRLPTGWDVVIVAACLLGAAAFGALLAAGFVALAHGNPVCFEPICTRCHEAIRAGTTLEIEAGRYVHPACAVEGGLA
jgi:hypothetical protein